MKTTIFLFHPAFAHSRANAALVHNSPVEVRDLYQLYPTELIDVAAEQAALSAADRIVWQFPLYWYSGPGLMKKWLDQVLTVTGEYVGMQVLPPFIVADTVNITADQLAAAAQRYHQRLLVP